MAQYVSSPAPSTSSALASAACTARCVRADLLGERDRSGARVTRFGEAIHEAEAFGAVRGQELAGEEQLVRNVRREPPHAAERAAVVGHEPALHLG